MNPSQIYIFESLPYKNPHEIPYDINGAIESYGPPLRKRTNIPTTWTSPQISVEKNLLLMLSKLYFELLTELDHKLLILIF